MGHIKHRIHEYGFKLRDKRDIVLYPCMSRETSHLYMQHAWRPTNSLVGRPVEKPTARGDRLPTACIIAFQLRELLFHGQFYEHHFPETCPSVESTSLSKYFVKMAVPLRFGETNGPPLDEAFSKKYSTWVKSSLIPRFREKAPSLVELCAGLIETLDETRPKESSAADAKTRIIAAIPTDPKGLDDVKVSNHLEHKSNDQIGFGKPDQASLNHRLDLGYDLFNAFPEFFSYAHLDTSREHPQEKLRVIAKQIMHIQLRWMDEERVEATWITPNILLDGILGSVDPKTLQALCEAHSFKNIAMVSVHPDDWVAGGVWKAHGRLNWSKRQSRAQGADDGVHNDLIRPLWDQATQLPQIIVQNDVEYRSPVTDHLIIPLEDGDGSSLLMQLPNICTFISQHDKPDTLIVIHCKVGLSRSNACQEAFVLQAVYQMLRKDARWMGQESEQKRAELQTISKNYHKLVKQHRPALKSKFPNQMANWAKYLADDEPECGPEFATDHSSAGGNDMRDAAIVACYNLGYLLPPTLISHYHERTGAGMETAQKTIRRFDEAEKEQCAGVSKEGSGSALSRMSIAQFVSSCEAAHKANNGENLGVET